MTVKIFDPPNRLAKIDAGFEGSTFAELVAASEARIDTIGPSLRRFVAEEAKRIVAIYEEGEEIMFARCYEMRDAAMAIADVAAAGRMPHVGEAAAGIRAMIESLSASGVWHTDALELHVTSLVLLSHDPAPSEMEAQTILTRLRGMRKAIGVVE